MWTHCGPRVVSRTVSSCMQPTPRSCTMCVCMCVAVYVWLCICRITCLCAVLHAQKRGLTLAIAGGTAGEEDQLSCVPWPAGRTDDARLSQHSSPRFCPAQPRTLDLTRNAFAMMRVLLALSFICRMPPLCFRVFKNPDMAALNTRLVLSVLHRRSPPRQSPSKRLSSPPTANTPLRSRPLLPSPFSLSLRWR